MTHDAYRRLMEIFSRPRPPGSAGERATARAIREWLEERNIPYRVHTFTLYPYFFESIGLWIILSRTLLCVAVVARAGWVAFLLAVVGLLGGTVDILLGCPLVTWPGRCRGENFVLEFGSSNPRQEMVFTAHYDSKTELLDHRQRAIFVDHTRLWAALTLVVGLMAPIDAAFSSTRAPLASAVHGLAVGFAVVLVLAAWGFGLHLSMGRLVKQSCGAVDDGAACAVLLSLSERLAREGVPCPDTRVTVVLFTGEEANMQGSRAYVRAREWALPTRVVNLELLGQNAGYVIWEKDGDAFHRVAVPPDVREWLANVLEDMTGARPKVEGVINSDGFSFLRHGITAVTLGTQDRRWGTRGLHRPTDCMDRVDIARLPEHVDLLWALLKNR